MYLKVRDADGLSWHLYGGIDRIHYGTKWEKQVFYQADGVCSEKVPAQIHFFRMVTSCGIIPISDPDVFHYNATLESDRNFVHWAIVRMQDDAEKMFVFDQEAYILNDAGKTIERIA